MDNKSCTVKNSNSKIKVEENKRKAIFLNPERENFTVTEVDGCLIPRGQTAADYLVVKPRVASILVELKGRNVERACAQLFSTIDNESVKNLIDGNLGFLVISSKYPRFDTFVQKAKQRAAKEFRAGFHVVTKEGEFDIERCAAIDGPR